MTIKLKNNVVGYLATAISASDTGVVLQTGNGANFPSLGAGEYFYATLVSSGGTLEVVQVTARSGDSMTVVRAQDGSSAAGFAVGSRVEMRVNAQAVLDVVDQVTASQVGFTPTGGIAATDVQAAISEVVSDFAASSGSSLVGFLQSGTGASSRTVQSKLRDVVSVKDFGAVGDGVTDDYTAISNALNAAIAGGKQLMFPPGIYRHSGVINFGSERLRVFGVGTARLRYTGAASAGVYVQFIGGVGNDVTLENLWFEGNANTTALYIENACRSVFKNIRIGNVTDYGVLVLGGVLDVFENIVVSLNDTPYYPGIWTAFPKYGIYLNNSSIITQTTDCTFINPIVEGVSEVGIYLEDAANNTFVGGTSEGNTGTTGTWNGVGIVVQTNSPNNVFLNMFCEANKNGDLVCYGDNNEFVNCAMTSRSATVPYNAVKSIIIKNGAEQNRIRGGQAYSCTVESGAVANIFERCNVDDVVSDSGTRTQILWTRQLFNTSDIVPGFTAGNLANANPLILDWYQEGTFTPTFGGSTSDGTISFDVQVGRYTRIGDTVSFQLVVRVNVITSGATGDLLVRGLPFAGNAALDQAAAVGSYNNITLPASRVQLAAFVVAGTSYLRLTGLASGLASSLVQGSGLGAAALIAIFGSYKV